MCKRPIEFHIKKRCSSPIKTLMITKTFEMESTNNTRTEYCRFKVGLGPEKRLYISKVEDIMRFPESTLARCLTLFKEDGRKTGNYIEIPHEGRHFEEILYYMAGDRGPLYRSLCSISAQDEVRYHCLDMTGLEGIASYEIIETCTPGLRIDVFKDIAHLMAAIEYTTQPQILILNYVNDRGTEEDRIHADAGGEYMRLLMDRVDFRQCRVIGFEGDMLGLGHDDWTQSAVVLGWREQPKYGLELGKWYYNLIHRKCLVERRPIGEWDLAALIDRLDTFQ